MYCKQCGFTLDDNANSCPNCGTARGMGQSFCPDCGSSRVQQSNFCQNCGFNFSGNTAVNPNYYGDVTPNAPVQNRPVQGGFDFKAYGNEYVGNVKSVLQTPDKLRLGLRYGSYAVSVLIFLLMFFPIISIHVDLLFFTYKDGVNLFSVSGFGGFMFILALLASAATFLPHVQTFIKNNQRLEPFAYLIVPLLELLGLLSMLIGVGVTNSAAKSYYGDSVSIGLGFCGWLILLLSLAGIGAAVYSFIKYDLAYVKANNPFQNHVTTTPKQSISDAMNGDTYKNTVYYGNDIDNQNRQ